MVALGEHSPHFDLVGVLVEFVDSLNEGVDFLVAVCNSLQDVLLQHELLELALLVVHHSLESRNDAVDVRLPEQVVV